MHRFSAHKVYENFEVFHEYFNYLWLGVPKKFFPTAMKALGGLLAQPSADELRHSSDTCDYLKQAIDHMRLHGQSDAEIKGHNLVYLHVNYNTFRLAFWAINHVLEDPKAQEALLRELQVCLVLCCNWRGSMPMPQWPNGGGVEWVVESTIVTHSSADWWDVLLPLAYTPDRRDRRLLVSPLKDTGKAG